MKLKELLRVMKRSQKVSIFDEYGELCDADEVENLRLVHLMNDMDRRVIDIYYDSNDDSISIELADDTCVNKE